MKQFERSVSASNPQKSPQLCVVQVSERDIQSCQEDTCFPTSPAERTEQCQIPSGHGRPWAGKPLGGRHDDERYMNGMGVDTGP